MTDPDRERREGSINRMWMIAFVLAAIVGLLSIIYIRPMPMTEPSNVTTPK